MTLPPPTYDLVLMLDAAADDSARTRIVGEVERMISSGGEALRHDDWGDRALAYPIAHKGDAHYHLFQFHATPELLEQLQRTLRITDGVVRFRLIKLKPGTPEAPTMAPARREEPAAAPASTGDGQAEGEAAPQPAAAQ